jgi:hypothetical protein
MFRPTFYDTRTEKNGVRLLYLKIGKGSYPLKPAQQIKDDLKPPEHRFKKDDRQSVSDLLSLCCRKDENPVATIDATCRPTSPSKINANKTMCKDFNIRKLDKGALALHLACQKISSHKSHLHINNHPKHQSWALNLVFLLNYLD